MSGTDYQGFCLQRRRSGLLACACLHLIIACGGSEPPLEKPLGVTTQPPPRSPIRLTLRTTDGENIEMKNLRGSRVLLFLFTTYDLPSQVAIEHLRRFVNGRSGFKTIGVALQPNAAKLLDLYDDYLSVPFPLTYDPHDKVLPGLSDLGRIEAVPAYVVLDEQGRIIGRRTGVADAGQLDALLGSGSP